MSVWVLLGLFPFGFLAVAGARSAPLRLQPHLTRARRPAAWADLVRRSGGVLAVKRGLVLDGVFILVFVCSTPVAFAMMGSSWLIPLPAAALDAAEDTAAWFLLRGRPTPVQLSRLSVLALGKYAAYLVTLGWLFVAAT